MTTSLILTQQEWEFALSGTGDPGGLCAKGLAATDENDKVTPGPELRLITEEYRDASCAEIAAGVTAARGGRFCMMVEPYPLIKDAIKITLYKDYAALEEAQAERGATGEQ